MFGYPTPKHWYTPVYPRKIMISSKRRQNVVFFVFQKPKNKDQLALEKTKIKSKKKKLIVARNAQLSASKISA